MIESGDFYSFPHGRTADAKFVADLLFNNTNGLSLELMGPFSCSDRGDTFWL